MGFHKVWLAYVASIIVLACVAPEASALRPPYGTASADLGFTGAVLTIKSTPVAHEMGSDHRQVTLLMSDGRKRAITLHDGGGHLGNDRLALYFATQDQFLLLSEKDCLAINPIKATLKICALLPECGPKLPQGAAYLGSFDWMNGYDRPKGNFVYRFRFEPFYDASC